MKKKNKVYILKKIVVPIYNVDLYVVETNNIGYAIKRKDMRKAFGNIKGAEGAGALAIYNRRNFAVCFERGYVCLEPVSHEVLHITHRILDWTSSNFDNEHHEQACMLHGYLMKKVAKILNLKVKRKK